MYEFCTLWRHNKLFTTHHYDDVIMTTIASQITSLAVVYSIVYSDADQRKHQSSASLAFVCGEFTGDRWIARTNGQLRGKCFHLMTSSWFSPTLPILWLPVARRGKEPRHYISRICHEISFSEFYNCMELHIIVPECSALSTRKIEPTFPELRWRQLSRWWLTYHIDIKAKWPPFFLNDIEMNFLEFKSRNFTETCF